MEYPHEAIQEVVEYAQELREHHRKEDGSRVSKVAILATYGTDPEVVIDFTNEEESDG